MRVIKTLAGNLFGGREALECSRLVSQEAPSNVVLFRDAFLLTSLEALQPRVVNVHLFSTGADCNPQQSHPLPT